MFEKCAQHLQAFIFMKAPKTNDFHHGASLGLGLDMYKDKYDNKQRHIQNYVL